LSWCITVITKETVLTMKPIFNSWILAAMTLGMLVWVIVLNCQTREELGLSRATRQKMDLKLHTFNMRKSDLHLELWENRRDIFHNRAEIAKVRAIMIPPNYHITLIPLLVPDKLAVPAGMLKPENLPKKEKTQ